MVVLLVLIVGEELTEGVLVQFPNHLLGAFGFPEGLNQDAVIPPALNERYLALVVSPLPLHAFAVLLAHAPVPFVLEA